MTDFDLANVKSMIIGPDAAKFWDVDKGSLELSMLEMTGRQVPVFVWKHGGHTYCSPLGSVHLMST